MSNSTITPIRPANAFETARLALIKKLLEIKPPKGFSIFPHPGEFSTVIEHMHEVAEIANEWLSAIGHEVADNSSCRIDIDQFRSAFTGALDGATWECTREAEALIEEHNEMVRSA